MKKGCRSLKKNITLAMLVMVCLLLSACSVTINTGESKEKKKVSSHTKTYHVGELILKDGNHRYYYSGIVYDSVVINDVRREWAQDAHSIPLFIESKSAEVKFPTSKFSIQIKDIDRKKETVTLTINK